MTFCCSPPTSASPWSSLTEGCSSEWSTATCWVGSLGSNGYMEQDALDILHFQQERLETELRHMTQGPDNKW